MPRWDASLNVRPRPSRPLRAQPGLPITASQPIAVLPRRRKRGAALWARGSDSVNAALGLLPALLRPDVARTQPGSASSSSPLPPPSPGSSLPAFSARLQDCPLTRAASAFPFAATPVWSLLAMTLLTAGSRAAARLLGAKVKVFSPPPSVLLLPFFGGGWVAVLASAMTAIAVIWAWLGRGGRGEKGAAVCHCRAVSLVSAWKFSALPFPRQLADQPKCDLGRVFPPALPLVVPALRTLGMHSSLCPWVEMGVFSPSALSPQQLR